jgi:hypothetical protein
MPCRILAVQRQASAAATTLGSYTTAKTYPQQHVMLHFISLCVAGAWQFRGWPQQQQPPRCCTRRPSLRHHNSILCRLLFCCALQEPGGSKAGLSSSNPHAVAQLQAHTLNSMLLSSVSLWTCRSRAVQRQASAAATPTLQHPLALHLTPSLRLPQLPQQLLAPAAPCSVMFPVLSLCCAGAWSSDAGLSSSNDTWLLLPQLQRHTLNITIVLCWSVVPCRSLAAQRPASAAATLGFCTTAKTHSTQHVMLHVALFRCALQEPGSLEAGLSSSNDTWLLYNC